MKKVICIIFIFLLIAVSAGISCGQNADIEKIGKLLEELNALQKNISKEQTVQDGLTADNKLLLGQDKAIKSIEAQYNKDLPAYEHDLASWKADKSNFEAGKSGYVSRYGCWDCKGKIFDQQTINAQIAELNMLNPQLDRINAEEKRIDSKHDELVKTFGLMKEGKETLSKATLDWAAKKKASNAKMNELIARYQELTKTYLDLTQRAELSAECKQIAYSNNRPVVANGKVVGMQSGLDFEVLNGVMERAHHCLQKVWDGAK